MIGGDFMRRVHTVNSKAKHKNDVGELVQSPLIVLHGKYVEKLGFKQGDRVLIRGRAGLIIVKLLRQE